MEKEKLNLIPNGFKQTCYCSQGDDGRVIRFELLEGISPYTLDGSEVITNSVKKPNGDTIINSVPNTELSYIDVTISADITELAGVAEGEVTITKAGAVIGTQNYILEIEADAYGADVEQRTATGVIATFTTNIADLLQEVKCEINATGGNGTPDNPNPINGYSSANITRCGVNLIDISDLATTGITFSSGDLSGTAGAFNTAYDNGYDSGHAFNATTQYTVSMKAYTEGNVSTSGNGLRVGFIYTDGTKNYLNITNDTTMETTVSYTSTSGKTVKSIYFTYGSASANIWHISDLMLEEGTTDTTYHPYTGNTYTIAFGQTVYGGVPDVTRGKLHVTHGIAVFDGTEVYSNYFPTVVCEKQFTKGSGTPVDMACSHAPTVAIPNQWFGYANANNTKFEFRKVGDNWGCADVDIFKTFIATQYANGTPVQICYPLDTPFDIDLTPQQIEALLGVNNVLASTGAVKVNYLYRATDEA